MGSLLLSLSSGFAREGNHFRGMMKVLSCCCDLDQFNDVLLQFFKYLFGKDSLFPYLISSDCIRGFSEKRSYCVHEPH